jgi:hypothetical protein
VVEKYNEEYEMKSFKDDIKYIDLSEFKKRRIEVLKPEEFISSFFVSKKGGDVIVSLGDESWVESSDYINVVSSSKMVRENLIPDLRKEEPEIKDIYKDKLDYISEAVNKMLKDHERIEKKLTDIHSDVMTSKKLIYNLFKKYPIEVTKIISIFIGIFAILGILLGKILNRIILAPDVALVSLVFSIAFWTVASIRDYRYKKVK